MRRALLVAIILALMLLPAVPGRVLGASVLWQAWIHETDDPAMRDIISGARDSFT